MFCELRDRVLRHRSALLELLGVWRRRTEAGLPAASRRKHWELDMTEEMAGRW